MEEKEKKREEKSRSSRARTSSPAQRQVECPSPQMQHHDPYLQHPIILFPSSGPSFLLLPTWLQEMFYYQSFTL